MNKNKKVIIIVFLLILEGSIYFHFIKTLTQPEYKLIVNYSSFISGRTGAVK